MPSPQPCQHDDEHGFAASVYPVRFRGGIMAAGLTIHEGPSGGPSRLNPVWPMARLSAVSVKCMSSVKGSAGDA